MYSSTSVNHHHLSNLKNPVIFVANYNHIFNAFWIINSLPEYLKRDTYFINDLSVQQYPFIPYSLIKTHALPLDKYGDPIRVLKLSLSVIKSRKNLVVFPEGQVSKSGHMGAFKSGIALLARETGATIVPVSVVLSKESQGAFSRIIFGSPFSIGTLIEKGILDQNATHDEISGEIKKIVSNLSKAS